MSHAPASIRLTLGDVKRLEAKVRAELKRFHAQRADTARLDWLEAQQSYSLSNLGGGPTHHLYVSEGDAEQSVRTVRTATKGGLREVIDALRGGSTPVETDEPADQLLADIIEQALERAFDAGASNNTMPGWEGIEQLAINTAAEIRGALPVLEAASEEPVEQCEGGCGPATTSDGEGVPLCDSCAWSLDREVLEEIATLVGFDRDKHDDLVSAVKELVTPVPVSRETPSLSAAGLWEDVLRCIPADWRPDHARELGKLGPILAEFIDDLREGRYPPQSAAARLARRWIPESGGYVCDERGIIPPDTIRTMGETDYNHEQAMSALASLLRSHEALRTLYAPPSSAVEAQRNAEAHRNNVAAMKWIATQFCDGYGNPKATMPQWAHDITDILLLGVTPPIAPPSAAGVTVTEAMVEAACDAACYASTGHRWSFYKNEPRSQVFRDNVRIAITAALTAAREVQP